MSNVDDLASVEIFRVWIIGPSVELLVAHFKTKEHFKDNVFEIPMVLIQLGFGLLLSQFLAAVHPRQVFWIWSTQF